MIKNKRDVERLGSELDQIQEHTHRLSEESFNQAIKNLWKQLKIQEGDKTLKTIPMDTISTLEKGMPINLLVNHGFQTIYDIKDERPADLMAINGIGEKGTYSIFDAVSKIKKSVYEHANPRINPDNLSENDIKLLASIYEKRKLLSKVHALQERLDQLMKDIGSDIEMAKEKKGFIGSLFQSKSKKEKINTAFDRLKKRMSIPFEKNGTISLISLWIEIKSLNTLSRKMLLIIRKSKRSRDMNHLISHRKIYLWKLLKR